MTRINQFEQSNKGMVTTKLQDPELFLRLLYSRTEPYHLLALNLDREVRGTEKGLFGDDSDSAGALWRATLFLRGSKLPYNVSASAVRGPMIKFLVDEDYEQARYYIEDIMAKYPEVLPSYVVQDLQIEPDVLRDLYAEEERILEQNKPPTAKEKELRAKDTINELMGRELVSPDGKLNLTVSRIEGSGYTITNFRKVIDEAGVVHGANTWKASDLYSLIELLQLRPSSDHGK